MFNELLDDVIRDACHLSDEHSTASSLKKALSRFLQKAYFLSLLI